MSNDLTDEDLAEIARLIENGFTSGKLSNDEKNIVWKLTTDVWLEDEDK